MNRGPRTLPGARRAPFVAPLAWAALAVGTGAAAAAGCNFVVGAGDYAIAHGPDATAAQPDAQAVRDAANETANDAAADQASLADRASDALEMSEVRESGSPDVRGDAGQEASADANGSPGRDAMADGDATGPAAEGGIPDAGDADAGDSGMYDADSAMPEAEAGPACGQSIPTPSADFRQLVTACVFAASCDPFVIPVSLSECISRNALNAGPSLSCLSNITSCNGSTNSYYSCEGVRYATTSECPSLASTCDPVNNVAIDCDLNYGTVTDCALVGALSTCQLYPNSTGGQHAGCVVAACPSADDSLHCAGNDRYQCVAASSGPIGVGRSCGTTTCTTSGNSPECERTGTGPCSTTGAAQCSGSTLHTCDSSGQVFDYDCARAGGACVTSDAGVSACVSPGCRVDSTCVESCDKTSTTLTVCVGGAPFAIHCPEYGFSSCGSAPSNGSVYCLP